MERLVGVLCQLPFVVGLLFAQEDANAALSLNATVVDGHHLCVDLAENATKLLDPKTVRPPLFCINCAIQKERSSSTTCVSEAAKFFFVCAQRNYSHSPQTVVVGNLPFSIEDEPLWQHFDGCGSIKAVRVIRDKDVGMVRLDSLDSEALWLCHGS